MLGVVGASPSPLPCSARGGIRITVSRCRDPSPGVLGDAAAPAEAEHEPEPGAAAAAVGGVASAAVDDDAADDSVGGEPPAAMAAMAGTPRRSRLSPARRTFPSSPRPGAC